MRNEEYSNFLRHLNMIKMILLNHYLNIIFLKIFCIYWIERIVAMVKLCVIISMVFLVSHTSNLISPQVQIIPRCATIKIPWRNNKGLDPCYFLMDKWVLRNEVKMRWAISIETPYIVLIGVHFIWVIQVPLYPS